MEIVRNYVEMFRTDVINAHQQFSPADNYLSNDKSYKKQEKKRRGKLSNK